MATKNPVTEEDVRAYADAFHGGVHRPTVTTGKVDSEKTRIAKRVTGSGRGMFKNAGMMIDFVQNSQAPISGYQLDAYRTSYANGLDQHSGTYDVPRYFQQMNQQNGGLLYWPVTLQEKYSWYRYWARSDSYIGRALELLADLPMSKLTLSVPKHVPKELRDEILDFYTAQLDEIDAFQLLLNILWEVNMIGNCFCFNEWDDKRKMWSRAVILPPEEVFIFEYPFSKNARVEYRPERIINIIKNSEVDMQSLPNGEDIGVPGAGDCLRGNLSQEILDNIPQDIVDMVREKGCIVMDTDPMTGSFVHHIARRKSPYQDLGASALERVLVPMLQKEHYRYTQLSLASRNMTPKNLITAPGLMPEEVDDLRVQVDLSYDDPEYSIITNYEVTWEQIGAQDRLIDLSREYETIDAQIFAALGVTRELLTGEGAYSGTKITVEILNTMFMHSREVLKNYLEKKLFKPIAEAHGWYSEDRNGIKKYWSPMVSFNRLTIRDNSEVFDSLYMLYQKGSLPIEVIYELFNLDADNMAEKLKKDLFTVNDPTFNRMVEEINSEVGRKIVETTNITKRQADYLGLEYTESQEEDGGFGGDFGDNDGSNDFGGFGEEQPSEDTDIQEQAPDEEVEKIVDEATSELPPTATEDEIRQLVEEKSGEL